MPRFKYKARSADGPDKIGYLSAPDADAAGKYLEKKGYDVDWVRSVREFGPEGGSSQLVFKTSQQRTVYGREFDVGQYRPGVGDLIQDHKLPAQAVRLLLGLVAALGVIVLIATWTNESVTPGGSTNEVRYRVQVTGRVNSPVEVEDLELTVIIPEIPYQKSWRGPEAFDESGDFKTEFDFITGRLAGQCHVRLTEQGRPPIEKRGLTISGPETVLELGTLFLR